jgi:hypothetical protein
MWLPWKAALALAAALAIVPFLVVIGLFARPKRRGPRFAMSFARETAVVLGLYALWQYAGTLALLHVDGAVNRGHWIWDFEHRVHLPSELTVQHVVMHSSLLVQALNLFYATMHFPGMIAFLAWMFVRHRDRYPQVRNTMVLVTGAALAIQLVPVAPPRLTPGLGFVDTPMLYGQSVYAKVGTAGPDQLSALPSVHVAWALLVALGVVLFSTSKWRWFILAHPFLTILAVVATANHWWLDGIVAAQLIGLAVVVERLLHAGLVGLRNRVGIAQPIAIEPPARREWPVPVEAAPEPAEATGT